MKKKFIIITKLYLFFSFAKKAFAATPTPLYQGTCDDGQVHTALGCFSTDINGQFFIDLIKITVGLGGGIALLLILVGTFIITTSAGIPDKIKAGQSIITSAITGLIFIILSFFIMNMIGVRIIQLPGL
jgi:hypothetical protein